MDNNFAEQALIGCLLKDGASSTEIEVDPSEFENAQYSLIYRSILAVIGSDEVMDTITVAEHLHRTTDKNWMPVLFELSEGAFSTSNVKSYAQIIRNAHKARQASLIGAQLMQHKNEPDAVQNAIRALMEIGKESTNHEHTLQDAMRVAIEEVDRAFRNPGELVGVSTGISDLDFLLGGLHPGDLVIVGARPAMGKTAVMLNMMLGADRAAGCVSGEQGVSQLMQRLLAITGRVSLMNMRNGKMGETDWPRLEVAARKLMNKTVMFNDRPAPRIEEIEASARRWKYEHNISALYVDYLQRIKRDPKKPKHEAVGDNAARLKELARELDIPVVCLAQVNRAVEQRSEGQKRPRMGDLADSSEIEKEADLIMMLYRDEVYNPDTHDKGIMEILIDKNRHGATGVVSTAWDGRYLTVSDLCKYEAVA